MSIQALREQLSHETRAMKALLAEKGSIPWTADDQTKFDAHAETAERLEAQIKATQRMQDIEASAQFEDAKKQASKGGKGDEIDAVQAVALYLRHGSNLTAEQALKVQNTLSTTTNSEGGFTVPTEVSSMVVDSLRAFGGMREIAQILTTAGGNPMNWPTSDGTSEVGAIVAENANAPQVSPTFGTVAVNPFKYTSNRVALPWELIQDSAVDVVAFVVNRLAERLGRITNTHYTIGTGTGQPFGVMTRATVGRTGSTGQTLTVTYDDLIDLIHSVNSAYRTRGARFMMRDTSVAVIRKIKDTTGRPIWNPGDNESIAGGQPGTICGYQYTVNDDVAAMAANARSIAFGDFSKFIIRDVQGSVLMRRFDDSAFALNGQVGFCGWMRTGSNLVDTAAVRVYVNSAT